MRRRRELWAALPVEERLRLKNEQREKSLQACNVVALQAYNVVALQAYNGLALQAYNVVALQLRVVRCMP